MFGLLAILFIIGSVLVHGGAITVHNHWFNYVGLFLLAVLCWMLGGYEAPAWMPRWHKRQQ